MLNAQLYRHRKALIWTGFFLIFLMFALSITSLCFVEIGHLEGPALSNCSILAFSIIMCLIIYSSVALDRSGDATRYIFLALIFFTTMGLFFSFVAFSHNGEEGTGLVQEVARTAMLLSVYGYIHMFWIYTRYDLRISKESIRKASLVFHILFIMAIWDVILNLFLHHLFYVEDGVFKMGGMPYIATALISILGIFVLITAMLYAKDGYDRRAQFIYIMLPTACLIGEAFAPEYSMFFVSLFITMMLFYGHFYVNHGKDMAKKDKALSEQRFTSMYSQINPHFLYNSLTSIMNLPGATPEMKDAIADFGKYLRGNLDSVHQTHPIQIGMEISHVETYVQLEQMRFKDRLKVEFDIQDRMYFIPALCLQMMVENAIRHGVTMRAEGGTVRISSVDNGTFHVLTVVDDGIGFDMSQVSENGPHYGIINTRNLLKMVRGTLEIESTPGVGTKAVIRIPKKQRAVKRSSAEKVETGLSGPFGGCGRLGR